MIPRRPRLPVGEGTHFSRVASDDLVDVENEDWAAALCEFGGGTVGSLEASRVIVGPARADALRGLRHARRAGLGARAHERARALRSSPTDGDDEGYTTRLRRRPAHGAFEAFQPGAGVPMGYDDLRVIEAAQLPRRDPRRRAARARASTTWSRPRACSRRSSARRPDRRVGGRRDERLRVANAPLSYGAFEMTVGTTSRCPTPSDVLAAIGERRLRRHRPRPARLPRRGRRAPRARLEATGSASPAASSRSASASREHWDEDLAGLHHTLDLFDAAGAAAPAPGAVRRRRPGPHRQPRPRRRGRLAAASTTAAGARSSTASRARPTSHASAATSRSSTTTRPPTSRASPEIERFLEDTDVRAAARQRAPRGRRRRPDRRPARLGRADRGGAPQGRAAGRARRRDAPSAPTC